MITTLLIFISLFAHSIYALEKSLCMPLTVKTGNTNIKKIEKCNKSITFRDRLFCELSEHKYQDLKSLW